MATSSDWIEDEEEDHATFVRITELEKQLKQERERLSSKCLNPHKPRKCASKPPQLQNIQEHRTKERAYEILEEKIPMHYSQHIETQNSGSFKQKDADPNEGAAMAEADLKMNLDLDTSKKDKKRKKKEAKRAELEKKRAQLEKLQSENRKIESQEVETDEILAKLENEIMNEKKIKAEKLVSGNLQERNEVKRKDAVESDAAELLKKEIEKQEQEGKAIELQRKNIKQILHQMRKAQTVQICFVGNLQKQTTKQLLRLIHANISVIQQHLSPAYPKLEISMAFVLQNDGLDPVIHDFSQEQAISWKTHQSSFSPTNADRLLQSACRLGWQEGRTKILVFLLQDNHVYLASASSALETLQVGHNITRLNFLCEKQIDAGKQKLWSYQAIPTGSWMTADTVSISNVIDVLVGVIKQSVYEQEERLYLRYILGNFTPDCSSGMLDLQGTVTFHEANNHVDIQSQSELTKIVSERLHCKEQQESVRMDRKSFLRNERWTYNNAWSNGNHTLASTLNSNTSEDKFFHDSIDAMNVAFLLGKYFSSIFSGMKLEFLRCKFFKTSGKKFMLQDCPSAYDQRSKSDNFASKTISNTVETFSHWSYDFSKGHLLVDVSEGQLTNAVFQVTGVLVHSKDLLRYSTLNMGTPGMDRFFSQHICSDFCRRLSLKSHPKQVSFQPICTVQPAPEASSTLSNIGSSIKSTLNSVFSAKSPDNEVNKQPLGYTSQQFSASNGKDHRPKMVQQKYEGEPRQTSARKSEATDAKNHFPQSGNISGMRISRKEHFERSERQNERTEATANQREPRILLEKYQSGPRQTSNFPHSPEEPGQVNQPPTSYAAACKLDKAPTGNQLSQDQQSENIGRDRAEKSELPKRRSSSSDSKRNKSSTRSRVRSLSPVVRKKEERIEKPEGIDQQPKIREPIKPLGEVKLRIRKGKLPK